MVVFALVREGDLYFVVLYQEGNRLQGLGRRVQTAPGPPDIVLVPAAGAGKICAGEDAAMKGLGAVGAGIAVGVEGALQLDEEEGKPRNLS